MNTQSKLVADLAKAANLSTTQQLLIVSWMLDNDLRLSSVAGPKMVAGIPATLFETLRGHCLEGNRISAIKDLRQWAVDRGPTHSLGTLIAAKRFIDEHFPYKGGA